MNQTDTMKCLNDRTAKAVDHDGRTWAARRKKQESVAQADQGLRSTVKGVAQTDGFIDLQGEAVTRTGIPERFIFTGKAAELPGPFRPTLARDLIFIRDARLRES